MRRWRSALAEGIASAKALGWKCAGVRGALKRPVGQSRVSKGITGELGPLKIGVGVGLVAVRDRQPHLVPRRRVRRPMKTERMSLPKEAALTGSSFCSWQCSK